MHEAQLRQMLEEEQSEPDISAKQFLLKTLLWLPVCFIGWYLLAGRFVFEALSSLMLKTGVEITSQVVDLLPWTQSDLFLNATALGYQPGFLILPAVVPIAFWIMRHKGLLERLASQTNQ